MIESSSLKIVEDSVEMLNLSKILADYDWVAFVFWGPGRFCTKSSRLSLTLCLNS